LPLSDADNVAVWHGDRDDVVTLANASWLAEQIPNALLRVLPGEGHISIGLAIPEIFENLLSRIG
jgi:pimeloyl-ACP methyl ester carboxylesterase